MKIMFYEAFKEEEIWLRKFMPGSIKAYFTKKTIQESQVGECPAPLISIRTQSKIPISWAKKLRGILTRSQGFDHLVNYREAAKSRVPCGYLNDYCSQSVAEHALMATLFLIKKGKKQIKHWETFNRDELTGRECAGRHVLVIGVGNVGSKIVKLAKAMKMPVKGADIVHRRKNLSYVPLKRGLRWADVVICACPLTEQTRGMLGYKAFKLVRPGGIFINVSRGEVSPVKDLNKLLKEKRLSGLSLDVYEHESALAGELRSGKEENSYAKFMKTLGAQDNVFLTPHNAFNTEEAVERKARQTAEAIVYFLKHHKFPNPVPFPK